MTSFISEPLLTEMAMLIRKVAIEREGRVLHQRVDAEMNAFNRLTARRDRVECRVQLREIFGLDDDVKLADARRGEPQLAPRQPPALDLFLSLQVIEIG